MGTRKALSFILHEILDEYRVSVARSLDARPLIHFFLYRRHDTLVEVNENLHSHGHDALL